MRMYNNRAKRIKSLLFFLTVLIIFPLITGSINKIFSNEFENDKFKIASVGEHPWWNSNWPFRTLINITNQAGVDLKDYGVSVVLPYDFGDYQDNVNDTLKDIRIIEYINNNPVERDYYIFQDFDGVDYSAGKATIYFNTNLTASSSPETDTYIYFGNMNVETTAVEYGLGLVKNGDFEYVPSGDDPIGDPSVAPHRYNPVGWNWSDDVPDNIAPYGSDVGEDNNKEDQAIEWWQNCLIDTPEGHTQVRGTYTYKWGSNATSLSDVENPDDQFAGVLYTNPFVVPIVDGGAGSIELKLWRNIESWGFDSSTNKDVNDGYFFRVINASNNLFADPDLHQQLGEYIEYYKGIGTNNQQDFLLQNYTLATIGTTYDTSSELTGLITIDLSAYMGLNISLEFGMYGDENDESVPLNSYDSGFVQVDDIYFTYDDDISVVLNEVQSQKSDVTVIARDIDGRIVPNAEVSLIQDHDIKKQQTTDETGKTIFTGLNFGVYNFTVNYTFTPSYEDEVFNSTRDNFGTPKWNLYNVTQLSHTYDLYLDIWTIDFEIVDWDDDLLDDGYVKIFNDKEGTLLEQISLVNGTARFRRNNASFYYYEVYFYNTLYNVNNFLLNSSYIYRSDYVQNEKYYDHALPLGTYDQYLGKYYRIYERIYTGGSLTDFSNKKLINFNITLENMLDRIDNMTIYYIDKNNQTAGNMIYQNLTMSGTDFFESIDIGTVDNDKLKGENYEAYGILIDVQGYRTGAHTGLIKINTTELTNIYNKTALSKLNIRVIDDKAIPKYDPVPFVSIKIWNGTTEITTLTTNSDGWASHDDEIYKPFIFLTGYSYNMTLRRIGDAVEFIVNDTIPEQWEPSGKISIYNYSLYQESFVILDYETTPPPPTLETKIEVIADISQAIWGIGNLSITINVSYSEDGIIWEQVPDEGMFTCYIEDWETGQTVKTVDLTANYQGIILKNYSLTLNSSLLSAGDDFKKYWFIIDGSVPGYELPDPYYHQVQVNTSATFLDLYDYETLQPISEYNKEFGEMINITVKFVDLNNHSLEDATITLDWISQPTSYFLEDPINDGFYYCTIDTTLALSIGKYPINLIASKENYTSQTIITFLDIFERPTELNGTNNVIFLSESVYALETEYIEFNYTDVLTTTKIANPDEASYSWQKLDEIGDPIPGEYKIGTLIETADHRYILDLDTEKMELGEYFVFITFDKMNYELRIAVISLTIEDRQTSVNGTIGTFIINIMDTLNFTYSYIDNLTSTSITNLDTQSYTFNGTASGSGSLGYDAYNEVYYLIGFNTASLQNGTYTITVIFDKENYTSQEVVSTLIINYIITDYRTFLTLISQNPSNLMTDVYWRDEITINYNFTTQYQSNPQELAHPTTINLQFLDESLNGLGSPINLINYNTSKGLYSYTFNTSSFLLIGGESYYIKIYASLTEPAHTPPTPLLILFKVQSVLTDLTIHNYTTGTEFPSYTLTEYWNQTLGITIYYRELISTVPITNAHLTYSWVHGSGQINPDLSKGPGYYSFFFDTGNATEVGTYTINILAEKQNFSNGVPSPSLIINIISRPTLLRPTGVLGSDSIIFLSAKIYALETEYFEFNYTDVFTSMIIRNADVKSYTWQKLDEFGDPIPGETSFGTLIETFDHIYVLDLDTESMEIGEYFILITIGKLNYEFRSAVFSLTIEDRLTSVNGSIGTFIIDIGQTLNFTFSYIDDLTNTSIINLDTQSYTFNGTASGSGSLGYDSINEVYYLSCFDTASLLNGTYTITINFDLENYASQEVVISLVINYIYMDYLTYLTLVSHNPSNLTTAIFWREEITINFNFTTQYESDPQELAHPTTISLQFLDESLSALGSSINLINYNTSKGIYSYTFNTSQFLFIGGESYYIRIFASKTEPWRYTPPTPLLIFFKVQLVLTDLTIHNFTTGDEFPSYTLTEHWNQTFGITFYFGELINGAPITNAHLTYSWAYGSGQICPDATKDPGYYSFFFNTGDVPEIGTYIINILAVKQNFSDGIPNPNLMINVINRPTLLNSNDDVLYIRDIRYVLDSYKFTFEFIDNITKEIIKNADEKIFILHKRNETGGPIPGSIIMGSLYETADHQYILDFDSETLRVGDYSIVVTLTKENYIIRVAIISLTIKEREFDPSFSIDTIIHLTSGGNINFQITLTDPNNSSAPIIGATLSFTIRGINYNTITGGIIDNGDGNYTVNTWPVAEPFFMSETFIATLNIAKANFTSENHDFTVVVSMEEIFPGMPSFYFYLILGSIIGVTGSIVAYRVIQQARIPKHVKKIRKIKGLIKSKKTITEIPSIPTKEQMYAKLFGNDWKQIGLSLDEILGIQDLKSKKLQIEDKTPEEETAIDKIIKKKVKKEKIKKEKVKKERVSEEEIPDEKVPEEKVSEEEIPKERGDEE